MWKCINCAENVEDNFDICWNCNNDKNGSLSTFETIQKNQNNLKEFIKNNKNFPQNLEINPYNIIEAGKALKTIVSLVISLFFITVFGFVIVFFSGDPKIANIAYIAMGIIHLVFYILCLIFIHDAGDNLQKSVTEKIIKKS
jgi:hypothetical protein